MSNQIISAAVDTLTNKMVYSFTLVNKTPEKVKRTFWERLMRKPVKEVELSRSFNIYPCVVVNQYRIAAKAQSLPLELFEEQSLMLSLVPEHLPTIVYIIAAAIQNNKHEPEKSLITYIEDNIDNEEILDVLSASLQQANMQSFMNSIVLMNGVAKVLKTSPIDGSE